MPRSLRDHCILRSEFSFLSSQDDGGLTQVPAPSTLSSPQHTGRTQAHLAAPAHWAASAHLAVPSALGSLSTLGSLQPQRPLNQAVPQGPALRACDWNTSDQGEKREVHNSVAQIIASTNIHCRHCALSKQHCTMGAKRSHPLVTTIELDKSKPIACLCSHKPECTAPRPCHFRAQPAGALTPSGARASHIKNQAP